MIWPDDFEHVVLSIALLAVWTAFFIGVAVGMALVIRSFIE